MSTSVLGSCRSIALLATLIVLALSSVGTSVLAQRASAGPNSTREMDRCLRLEDKETAAMCLLTLGNKLGEVGQLKEAESAFRHVIRLVPGTTIAAHAYSSLGGTLGRLGRYEEAITALLGAIKIRPNDELAWSDLGVTYNRMGKVSEAIRAYQQCLAVATVPQVIDDAHLNLSYLHLRQGDISTAREYYALLLRRNPELAKRFIEEAKSTPEIANQVGMLLGKSEQDAADAIEQIRFGVSQGEARRLLLRYQIAVDNDQSTAATGFMHLGRPAAVEVMYVRGVVARKFIHLQYQEGRGEPRATFEKAVATLRAKYGSPHIDGLTAVWLVDPLFITVSEGKGAIVIGYVHRAFDPKTDRLFRGSR